MIKSQRHPFTHGKTEMAEEEHVPASFGQVELH